VCVYLCAGPACLQPQHLAAALSGDPGGGGAASNPSSSSLKRLEGAAGSGPFIYNPYAAKRKGESAAAAAQAALPEWVGDCCLGSQPYLA